MLKLAPHASQERLERIAFLVAEVGVGKTLITINDRGRLTSLTENGVILVYTDDTMTEVLTAYLASKERAVAMWYESFRQNGYSFNSQSLEHIEFVNYKYRKMVNKINAHHCEIEC